MSVREKLTAPFNNMRTLTFKAQPTNAFFATVNQVFSDSSQFPTTLERAVIKSMSTVQITKQCSAGVGSWEEPPNTWLTAAKNPFVGWALNSRVRMLLKGAVMTLLKNLSALSQSHWTNFLNNINSRFVPFFRNKFPGLFQDSYWFFKGSKIHINPYTPKISMLILLTASHTLLIFLVEFNIFPELSRTRGLFPGLSRFSRTRTNPVWAISVWDQPITAWLT